LKRQHQVYGAVAGDQAFGEPIRIEWGNNKSVTRSHRLTKISSHHSLETPLAASHSESYHGVIWGIWLLYTSEFFVNSCDVFLNFNVLIVIVISIWILVMFVEFQCVNHLVYVWFQLFLLIVVSVVKCMRKLSVIICYWKTVGIF